MSNDTITAFIPLFLCTGGLEGLAATCVSLGEHEHVLDRSNIATDIAGCIDAPESMPAGGMRCGGIQAYARRSQAFAGSTDRP